MEAPGPPRPETQQIKLQEKPKRPGWISFLAIVYGRLAFHYFSSIQRSYIAGAPPYMAYESIAFCIVSIFLAYGLWNLRTYAWYVWVIFSGFYISETVTTIPAYVLFYGGGNGEWMGGGFGGRILFTAIALLIILYASKSSIRTLFRVRTDTAGPIYKSLGVSLAISAGLFLWMIVALRGEPPLSSEFVVNEAEMLQSWEEFCFDMSERDFEEAVGDFLDVKTASPGLSVTTYQILHEDTLEYSWEFRDSVLIEYSIVYHLKDEAAARTRSESMIRDYTETYGEEPGREAGSYSWRVGRLKVNLVQDGSEIIVTWKESASR